MLAARNARATARGWHAPSPGLAETCQRSYLPLRAALVRRWSLRARTRVPPKRNHNTSSLYAPATGSEIRPPANPYAATPHARWGIQIRLAPAPGHARAGRRDERDRAPLVPLALAPQPAAARWQL